MPTEAEMKDYAKKLPAIYRDILESYPEVEPGRKAGFGLAFPTLAMHFINTHREWALGEVQEACKQLADSGFLQIKNGIFAHPTDLGEQLIATVASKPPAPPVNVPQLPTQPW